MRIPEAGEVSTVAPKLLCVFSRTLTAFLHQIYPKIERALLPPILFTYNMATARDSVPLRSLSSNRKYRNRSVCRSLHLRMDIFELKTAAHFSA